MKKMDYQKLEMWKKRLSTNKTAYEPEAAKMNAREEIYSGDRKIARIVQGDKTKEAPHIRNIAAELIESQVNSNIPQPKVTARREKDELKAKLIEDMIRNELDRMPFEVMNDLMERMVPIQGGAAFLIEWDNTQRTHTTVGELNVTALHPRQIIPQAGVYTGIEDMDYIILAVPQTKEYIRRKYGVSVSDVAEEEPETRGGTESDDMVTQYIAYYRNDNGGIGLYSWVGETTLDDIEDYQARRLKRCKTCGAVEGIAETSERLGLPSTDGNNPDPDGETAKPKQKGVCGYCGGTKFEATEETHEEILYQIEKGDGEVIPPGKIPFYKPDIFPVLLQKNVSTYGKFLGDSDIDKIRDQQNTTNRLSAKIVDKIFKSGSYITMPAKCENRVDAEDQKVLYVDDPSDLNMINVFNMQGNVDQDMAYLEQIYQEGRQVIGITDSFQGRQDRTATSGKAKEFAAAQSAGRLESKRIMKNAMYSALFEAMFKFLLAYSDEKRPVISEDIHGNKEYQEFNRYDFLEQDEAGEWWWNDQFLFSCDTTAPLANNREAMWQETRMNLQTGAFGDPANPVTLILFWTKMEQLHYPGAGETKRFLEEERQRQMKEQVAMQQQIMNAQAIQQNPYEVVLYGQGQGDIPPELMQMIEEKAKQDAQAAAMGGLQ